MNIAEQITALNEKIPQVYEAGKKSEYDKFWDSFQNKGKRTNYQDGFAGKGWNDTTFKPKYDIIAVGNLGRAFQETELKDLVGVLQQCGRKLDTSQVTTFSNTFYYSYYLTSIPEIDSRSSTGSDVFGNAFGSCKKLKTIEKLILKEDGSQPFSSTFSKCEALENIVIEGKIGQKGFNIKDCKKLTKASLLSILKTLSLNITATTTITFSTVHQSIIETDPDCKPYWEAAKNAGWSFVYA